MATIAETNAAGPPYSRIALPKNSAIQVASTVPDAFAERLNGVPSAAPAREYANIANAPTHANPSNIHSEAIPSTSAMVARLRYAWRCTGCRRILMRHHLPLKAIAALAGPLHIKCHCNQDNWLQ